MRTKSNEFALILLFSLFGIVSRPATGFGFHKKDERSCYSTRVNRMLKIRCHDMNLKEVPQNQKTSVEVFDLSYNRIKKLKIHSFRKYTDIKYLLLFENMIQTIEPGTFTYLSSLEEIDLSSNALMTIPLELFKMPRLRNLYVDSNDMHFLARDLEVLNKPIKAPLEYINIANCELNDIPDFGILPYLWHINASLNPLIDLTVARLAPLCQLSTIDLTKTQMSQCTCQQIHNHLITINASTKFTPVCPETLDINICPLPYNETIASEAYRSCVAATTVAEARSAWLFTGGCVGGAVLVLFILWYCLQQHRKTSKRKLVNAAYNRKNLVVSPKNTLNRDRRSDELMHCDI